MADALGLGPSVLYGTWRFESSLKHMVWSDEYVTIYCPNCAGQGLVTMDNESWTTCGTCKGLRMVRVPESKLEIYDPDDAD